MSNRNSSLEAELNNAKEKQARVTHAQSHPLISGSQSNIGLEPSPSGLLHPTAQPTTDRVAALARTLEHINQEYIEASLALQNATSIHDSVLDRMNQAQAEFREAVALLQEEAHKDSLWGLERNSRTQIDKDFLNAQ